MTLELEKTLIRQSPTDFIDWKESSYSDFFSTLVVEGRAQASGYLYRCLHEGLTVRTETGIYRLTRG